MIFDSIQGPLKFRRAHPPSAADFDISQRLARIWNITFFFQSMPYFCLARQRTPEKRWSPWTPLGQLATQEPQSRQVEKKASFTSSFNSSFPSTRHRESWTLPRGLASSRSSSL